MHAITFLTSNFNYVSLYERLSPKVQDSLYWLFIRMRLLWDSKEREQYFLYYKIKQLSLKEINPNILKLFKEKVLYLCEKISDGEIIEHLKRLNGGKLDNQPYLMQKGETKIVIQVHEVFEMLSMKWEGGVSFNKDRFSCFRTAHNQAVKVENIFYLSLALEKGLPLTKASLEYCRLADESHLRYPIATFSFSLDLKTTEENLTLNLTKIPNDPIEIDQFCDFFSNHSNIFDSRYKIGLIQRYLFSSLFKKHPAKKVYLIALIRALEKDQIYECFSLTFILNKLESHLEKHVLPKFWNEESLLKEERFFSKYPDELPWMIARGYVDLLETFT